MNTLEQAQENTGKTYEDLAKIAKSIADKYTIDVDTAIKTISSNVQALTNDNLRNSILDLSFKAYSLSEAKEYSSLKSDCANALMKEVQAVEFNMSTEKTAEAKRNAATLNSSNEVLTDMIYSTVSSLLKVKLDECHRVVDSLKNVLISRQAEAKLCSNETIGEPGEKTRLFE